MQKDMLHAIERHMRETGTETGCASLSPRVAAALLKVPRRRFVPSDEARLAEADSPLPIGHGQTISQPFIVALMTQLLDVQPHHRVLEIGAGSGYQAAVLAELAAHVYGIEIVQPLAERAAGVLHDLGYRNIELKCADGYRGWPEHAPFDGILVTAAGNEVPEPLKQQLAVGGKLVLPVESACGSQNLQVITRVAQDRFESRSVLAVRFVPLTGDH
jgi:protein-L-isoaspartate(D-aspartate) O-methyltransferase